MSGYRSRQGYRNISKALNVPKSMAGSTIVKWKECGTTRIHRAGHPAKLSNWAKRDLIIEVTKNLMATQTVVQMSTAEIGEPAGWTTIPEISISIRRLWSTGLMRLFFFSSTFWAEL